VRDELERSPMTLSIRRASALAVAIVALGAAASPAQALYLFFMRRDLAHAIQHDPDTVIDKQVCFTDELCVIWPEVQQRPNTLGGVQHVLFDTTNFHCAIPRDRIETHLNECWADAQRGYGEALKKLQEINDQVHARQMSQSDADTKRTELYWELNRIWKNKPIVTVYGKVVRADFWGPVKGADQGVATESISIVVDRVERPRQRWYEDGLDEN
jgi:hypothetical protein